MSCVEQFRSFCKAMGEDEEVKRAIERGLRMYNLKQYDIREINPSRAESIFVGIQEKFYAHKNQLYEMKWLENQLRLFIWCLLCYIYQKNSNLQSLEYQDWSVFKKFFITKSQDLFDYQTALIITYSTKPKLWDPSEDHFLTQVLRNKPNGTRWWNEISKELFLYSGKTVIRNSKQCRQRWNNHVDPEKIKGFWEVGQCRKMFEYVKEHGKKWAQIVRLFNSSRDEHSIKNRFNSLFQKEKKLSSAYSDRQIYRLLIEKLAAAEKEGITSLEEFQLFQLKQSPIETQENNFGECLRKKLISLSSMTSTSSVPTKSVVDRHKQQQQGICSKKQEIFAEEEEQYAWVGTPANKNRQESILFEKSQSGDSNLSLIRFEINEFIKEDSENISWLRQ